jgi:hypothetical protein
MFRIYAEEAKRPKHLAASTSSDSISRSFAVFAAQDQFASEATEASGGFYLIPIQFPDPSPSSRLRMN